ncbi:MAG: hypothetical protein U5L45_16700 [Saprospiraceae bacterium]|nr:hypothetical protein [Saprospiraceae bacterium]
MVRFSASPKNEPRLLPFARAKRETVRIKPRLFRYSYLELQTLG